MKKLYEVFKYTSAVLFTLAVVDLIGVLELSWWVIGPLCAFQLCAGSVLMWDTVRKVRRT